MMVESGVSADDAIESSERLATALALDDISPLWVDPGAEGPRTRFSMEVECT